MRRISDADALSFQAVHEAVYREHGNALVDVPAGSITDRTAFVRTVVGGELARR